MDGATRIPRAAPQGGRSEQAKDKTATSGNVMAATTRTDTTAKRERDATGGRKRTDGINDGQRAKRVRTSAWRWAWQ